MNEFNDLRLLSVFVAVFRQKSISAAARVLRISQPAVTRSIQRLESEVGVQLFHRSTTGIQPTEFGGRLYGRALSIIDELDSIHADAQHLGGTSRVLLKIGCGIGCWPSVCDAAASFQRDHTDTAFNITVASAKGLIAQAEGEGADLIVANRTTLESASGVIVEHWKTQIWYYAARQHHPVFDLEPNEQLRAIQGYPFATYHLLENAHGTSMAGPTSLRANDYLMLFRYVTAGDAYTIISDEILDCAIFNGLQPVSGSDNAAQETEIAIAYPAHGATSSLSRGFISHLRGPSPTSGPSGRKGDLSP